MNAAWFVYAPLLHAPSAQVVMLLVYELDYITMQESQSKAKDSMQCHAKCFGSGCYVAKIHQKEVDMLPLHHYRMAITTIQPCRHALVSTSRLHFTFNLESQAPTSCTTSALCLGA